MLLIVFIEKILPYGIGPGSQILKGLLIFQRTLFTFQIIQFLWYNDNTALRPLHSCRGVQKKGTIPTGGFRMLPKLVKKSVIKALAVILTAAIPEPSPPREINLAEEFAVYRRQGWSDAEIEIGIGGQ